VAFIHHSLQKNPDDVVITFAARTPLTKAGRGMFKDTHLDYILYSLLKEVKERSKIDPKLVEDVCLGNVCTTPVSFSGVAD
jgi:acetyl-CoA acetyltransferase